MPQAWITSPIVVAMSFESFAEKIFSKQAVISSFVVRSSLSTQREPGDPPGRAGLRGHPKTAGARGCPPLNRYYSLSAYFQI
jgi:hypothetical protein